jgi:hypothetical protein
MEGEYLNKTDLNKTDLSGDLDPKMVNADFTSIHSSTSRTCERVVHAC